MSGPKPVCDQTAPVNGVIVTCSGTTSNANPPNGWGTGVETGDTINVQPGASVNANAGGVALFVNSGTVNNDGGQIVGNLAGIKATNDVTVTNTVNGANVGVIATSSGNVIDGTFVTVTNNGIITPFAIGGAGTAIYATGTATVTNTGNGTTTGVIQNGTFGIDAGTVIVQSNTGKIEATAASGVAINAANDVTVTSNTGTVQANGTGGKAINGANVTVSDNAGTI